MSQVSQTISPKVSAPSFPKRTFLGRERVSLIPRWIGNWSITLVVTYFMGSYIAGFLGMNNPLDNFMKGSSSSSGISLTSTPLPDYPLLVPQSFYASSEGQSLSGTQTALPLLINPPTAQYLQPTMTSYPTFTPYPTQIKKSVLGEIYAIGYSYYFPAWGGVNCHPDNWIDNSYCKDTTASGLPWTQYIGKGVAVPYEWRDKLPLLSVIRVLDNVVMQGEYLVVDYCGDCIKEEGHIYFDFLDNRQRLAWTVPLLVEVVSIPND